MDKETMRMKLTYWSGIIKEFRASGMKMGRGRFPFDVKVPLRWSFPMAQG